MKVTLVLLALVGAAFAAPDGSNGGIRPIVNYGDSGSSVTILRGAELDGGRSYEARPRIRYAAVEEAPRVRVVEAPAPVVRYVQAAPEVRYVQAPAPRIRYVQSAPRVQVVSRPRVQTVRYGGDDDGQALFLRSQPRQVVRVPQQQQIRVTRPVYTDSQESYDDARYQFAYEVRDDETYNYQARQESRDGNRVTGSYAVQDPDGFLRTVVYGDDGNGFYATVKREPVGSSGAVAVGSLVRGDSGEK